MLQDKFTQTYFHQDKSYNKPLQSHMSFIIHLATEQI